MKPGDLITPTFGPSAPGSSLGFDAMCWPAIDHYEGENVGHVKMEGPGWNARDIVLVVATTDWFSINNSYRAMLLLDYGRLCWGWDNSHHGGTQEWTVVS